MAENKSIFHAMQVQSCNTNAILLSKKIYLCLLTPNCTRNHVVTYTKNTHEKFTRFWLAETKCICHVTRVQSWNMNTNYN